VGGVLLLVCLLRFLPEKKSIGSGGGLIGQLELWTYDWRTRIAFRHPGPVATNLAAVFIDDDDLKVVNEALGFHWPWPRYLFGKVIRELAAEGVARVGCDVFFLERQQDPGRRAGAAPPSFQSDRFFGRMLARAGNVVLGCPGEVLSNQWRVLPPIPVLRTNALALAYASADRDVDGVLRRARPFRDDPRFGRIWHLGILLAAGQLGLDLKHATVEDRRLTLVSTNGHDALRIPLDREGLFFVNWALAWNDARITKVSFTDVLAMDGYRQGGETNLESDLAGRLVVIGSLGSGSNISDVGATPLENDTYLVSLHWNIANALLTRRFIRPPPMGLELACILLMGALAAWVTWRMRPVVSSLVVLALMAGYVGGGVWLFVQSRFWLPLVAPLGGAMMLTHLTMVTYRVVFEQSEQRRVRRVFAKIVSPDVVTELLAQQQVHLGGALREVTVMFADVRGFTRMTEEQQQEMQRVIETEGATGSAAEALMAAQARDTLQTVNELLATIADQVKKHQGTLDKYIGDCVMAFWGAPVRNPRHAPACVRAALESQRAVARLNARRAELNREREAENRTRQTRGERPLPPIPLLSLGIGIHTGTAVVGLMGSEAHILNYTVFGREVNVASRLEGVAGRNEIVISQATYERLREQDPELAARCTAGEPVRLKGIAEPVPVFQVRWQEETKTG
jgi:adenylate cyclase